PTKYADMLSKKMKDAGVNVWLINTGGTGGGYGVGKRMKLGYTRAMITAALNGELDNVEFANHEVFGLAMPVECPNVPTKVLSTKNTWNSKEEYDKVANDLSKKFNKNFEKFADYASEEILAGAPSVTEKV